MFFTSYLLFLQGVPIMKKFLILAAVAMLAFAAPAFATEVGVFNASEVLGKSEVSKAYERTMQSKFGGERASLEKEEKALQASYESFQKQAATLSQKAREEKQMDIMRRGRSLEEKRRNLAVRVQRQMAELNGSMGRIVLEAASNVAHKRGLDLILDAAAGGIGFASPKTDVTSDMLNEVNGVWKKYGSKFPPASSASKK